MHEKGQLNIETGQLLNIWERSSQYWRHINSTLGQISSISKKDQANSRDKSAQHWDRSAQHLWLVGYRSAQKLYWPAQHSAAETSQLRESYKRGQLNICDRPAQYLCRPAQCLWQASSISVSSKLSTWDRSTQYLSQVSWISVKGQPSLCDRSAQYPRHVSSVSLTG